jgi:hypothetical protein
VIRRFQCAKLLSIALLVAVLTAAGNATLTAQVNTATIEAHASSADGQSLAGVTVRLTTASGGTRDATTDTDGIARLIAIPPGTYDVVFEFEGGPPVIERNVVLHIGQRIVVSAMRQPALETAIVVTATAPVVDLRKTDSSTNVVPEQIESLPVPDRDFQRLAFITPQVQRERGEFRFITNGPVIGAASNASQSTILVDGMEFTDSALGLATARLSLDSIREFRVIANRFDAEVGGSAAGALSIVTQSGTNDVRGKAFAFFRHDALRSTNELEVESTPFSRQQFGATIGGPLVRNRTHLFGSLEQIGETSVSRVRPTGVFQPQAADIDIPIDQTLALGRLDHQLNDRNRLTAKIVYERFRQENFRVGGVQDLSYGQRLDRDNWVLSGEHTWEGAGRAVNQLQAQVGGRKYDEPRNSTAVTEWFSNGNTLRTGGNPLGDLLGEGTFFQLRDTYSLLRGAHEIRAGFDLQHLRERSRIEAYESGLLIYVTDSRALPLGYAYGEGSSDVKANTTKYAGFIQDDWSIAPNLRVNAALRYDLDTNGNNPDFRHPLVPDGRDVDTNNFQPRASFSWDTTGDSRVVVRGGAGRFTGRYLLVPHLNELQQNGVTGRIVRQRINGVLLGLPALALDPARPQTTGVPTTPDIALIDQVLNAPSATQVSGGTTFRLGTTGLFADAEGVYVDGDDEIIVRDTNFRLGSPRANPAYNQINTYTNEGRSTYKALIFSLNGTLRGGHLITASYTLASKKNIADDFSPEFPTGYPNNPADIEAEYGRSRTDERHRIVLTGVLKAPFDLVVAPIYEYGSGQPWTHRLGYDFNGDGKNSDRAAGVPRFGESGPSFNQLSVRVTKALPLSTTRIELIAEIFNIFNTTNLNVATIDGAEFLSGPTLATPAAALVPNPNFGRYLAALPGRELQVGIRWQF